VDLASRSRAQIGWRSEPRKIDKIDQDDGLLSTSPDWTSLLGVCKGNVLGLLILLKARVDCCAMSQERVLEKERTVGTERVSWAFLFEYYCGTYPRGSRFALSFFLSDRQLYKLLKIRFDFRFAHHHEGPSPSPRAALDSIVLLSPRPTSASSTWHTPIRLPPRLRHYRTLCLLCLIID
jgi:hypothetical protein